MSHENLVKVYRKPLEIFSWQSTLPCSSNTPLRMKTTMKQLVSHMTQLSVHLLQPRSFRSSEEDKNKMLCYAYKK